MAQTGYTPILIYGSSTAAAVPTNTNLTSSANGAELALNYTDGKLYYKDNGGTVRLLTDKISVSVASANGFAGSVSQATATSTPQITLSTSITGVLKGNGTAISAAASGTDYAPPTSGTSILYGNGSGGFSNVTIGSGVSFAGGTLSATGSGGNVTTSGNNAFTGANTFYNATGQTFAQAATNDGFVIQGRAGGSSSYRITFTSATLSASRSVTFPDSSTTVPIASQQLTFTGPSVARTYTLPDASTTLLSTNAAVTVSQGGTGLTALGSALQVLRVNAGGTALEYGTLSAGGDVSGPASAVNSQIALFNGTTGKIIQAATTTGVLKATSGVIAAATAGTDYVAPSGALGTPSSGTLSSCTVDGTDAVGFRNVPQNVQTGSYTLVLSDSGKHIYRGSGGSATWTIPAATSVAYPIGTALTFINLSATSVSIAITTDTMYLSAAGTTGTRTLAQYGSATAIKISGVSSSGVWVISGSGLT